MERIGPEALQQDFLVWTAKGRPERDRAASSKRQKQEGPALTANHSRDISSTIRDTVVRTLGDVLESEAIKEIDRGLVPKAKKQQWKKYVAMSFSSSSRQGSRIPSRGSVFLAVGPESTDAPVPALAPMPSVVPKAKGQPRKALADMQPRTARSVVAQLSAQVQILAGNPQVLRYRLDKEILFSSIMMQVKEGVVAARSGQGRAGLPRL